MAALIYWRRAERLPASGVPVGAGRGVIRSARLLAVGRAGLAGLAGLALGRSREYDLRSLVVVAGAAAVVWSSTSQSWNLAAYRASIGQQSSRSGRADRGGCKRQATVATNAVMFPPVPLVGGGAGVSGGGRGCDTGRRRRKLLNKWRRRLRPYLRAAGNASRLADSSAAERERDKAAAPARLVIYVHCYTLAAATRTGRGFTVATTKRPSPASRSEWRPDGTGKWRVVYVGQ